MRPSSLLRSFKPSLPVSHAASTDAVFQIPALSSISVNDLPNNGFGEGNYYLTKTKFGHWPVYKKVQNTKITTEIKRVQGDIFQFKQDLIKLANINPQLITVNKTAGYVNIKGDVVDHMKNVFDEKLN